MKCADVIKKDAQLQAKVDDMKHKFKLLPITKRNGLVIICNLKVLCKVNVVSVEENQSRACADYC